MPDLLNAVGENSHVVVSKKWLKEIGLTVAPAPCRELQCVSEPKEEKIEFSVTDCSTPSLILKFD